MLRNKRGFEVTDMWLQVMRLIFTVFVVIAVLVILNFFVIKNLNTQLPESHILINRLMYGKHSLSFYDESIDRVYPGIIIPDALVDEKLDSMLYFEKNQLVTAKVSLYDKDNKHLKTAYYNKLWYDRLYDIAIIRTSGPGGALEIIEDRYVLYMEPDGTLKPGNLRFSVITPNAQ